MIKQREDQMQKKIEKKNNRVKDEEERRTKAHRRALAKIAYKDWKQTKAEELKLKMKQEQIERRQGMHNELNSRRGYGNARKFPRNSSAAGLASNNSSRYINTEHKRNQLGGHDSYNVKNVKVKKVRPKTANRQKKFDGNYNVNGGAHPSSYLN